MYDDDYDQDEMTLPCPNCKADVYEDTPRCPNCGEYITGSNRNAIANRSNWLRNLIFIVIALTILSFLLPHLLTLVGLIGKE